MNDSVHWYISSTHCNCYSVTANVRFIQDGSTPLMVASFYGHVGIVRILIEAQAQVNTQREVCCYKIAHYKKTCMYSTLQLCLFVSTGWLDCSSRGSSRRQSWCGESIDWCWGTSQHTDWGTHTILISLSLIHTTERIMYMNVVCLFLV